jgi:hypothetical protein
MPRWAVAISLALAALGPAVACSAMDAAEIGKVGSGGAGGEPAAGGGIVDPDGGLDGTYGGGAPPEVPSYGELCGGGCSPGTSGSPDLLQAPVPCALDGSGGAGGGGGSGGAGDCHLAVAEDDSTSGACTSPGSSPAGGPCLASADCAAGLGCVESGICRPYCCSNLEACPNDITYCTPRFMHAGDVPPGVTIPAIPVCIPATPCMLLDDSTCTAGETCTIVRANGATSCVVPGTAVAGSACEHVEDCAPGHYCALEARTCQRLCRLGHADDCMSPEACQSGDQALTEGYGVCVIP